MTVGQDADPPAGEGGRRLWVAGPAGVLLVLTVGDVLVFGGAHTGDQVVFRDGLPPRSGVWHAFWRVLVTGGQYWLVGSAAALATAWLAWRARSLPVLLAGGSWLVGSELVIRALQLCFGRTAPLREVDLLFAGAVSFPSGHAANAAACLTFVAGVLSAPSWLRTAAHAWAVLVAIAVVTLGYHWPSDAIAGWALGIVLGQVGRHLVRRSGRPGPRGVLSSSAGRFWRARSGRRRRPRASRGRWSASGRDRGTPGSR
ncbi:phosphatase PAP2 family protein [Nonomuraea sp. NPDC049607]|uniref:phosphatase PAP2 family protein n=1 Tax=Nonomuraea sp. NPDC049607 TaxID=3154732 RepID=UPI0034415021